MKVVFDTSVLFAAFITRHGLCASIVERAIEYDSVVLSDFILAELSRHLLGKAGLSASTVSEVMELLRRECAIVAPAQVDPKVCRDSNDAAVLGTCVAGDAEVLVTGDQDLVVLQRFGTTLILSPRQFHDRSGGMS